MNFARERVVSRRRSGHPIRLDVDEGPAGPWIDTERMRTRALILIALTVGWLLPAGARACSPHVPESEVSSQAAHHEGHQHSHGPSDRAEGAHAAAAGSQESESGAPLKVPTCCDNRARVPAVASVPDANPRPKPIPLALLYPLLATPEPVVLASGARLREPPPLPYARTRRPLLI